MKVVRLKIIILALLLLGGTGWVAAWAQEEESGTRLEVTALDRTNFPTLSVNLIATDLQSRPLASLAELRIRENGVPIADFALEEVAVGLDLIFVLDAVGESALRGNWPQTVQDTLLRFGGRYMEAGRDEVSLLVPAGEDGRWLVENSSDPGVLAAALADYAPAPEQEPQTLPLLARALVAAEEAEAPVAGLLPDDPRARFQAVLLFTSGSGLNRYLFPPLVEEAQTLGVPIFVIAYGPEPTPTTLETLTWLYRPTRGTFVHLADPAAADEIFEILAANGMQQRLRYESKLRQSGTYSVTFSLRQAQEQLLLPLELASPRVVLLWSDTHIRRVGDGPEAALASLQPAVQSIPIQVTWPGGTPRRVVGAALLLDGVRQPAQVTGAAPDLFFEWDITALDEGEYVLTTVVTDTLGLAAESEPYPLSVSVVRPAPLPTASPVPTPLPAAAAEVPERVGALPGLSLANLIAAGTGGVFLLILGATAFLLRRGRSRQVAGPGPVRPIPAEPLSARPGPGPAGAYLFLLGPAAAGPERMPLPGGNVVLGRAKEGVDIVLADSSVARLHARIRRRNGAYWLYDEGSASGTFLNFERLGLAPRPLSSGDEIRLGRVRLRFHQEQPAGNGDVNGKTKQAE